CMKNNPVVKPRRQTAQKSLHFPLRPAGFPQVQSLQTLLEHRREQRRFIGLRTGRRENDKLHGATPEKETETMHRTPSLFDIMYYLPASPMWHGRRCSGVRSLSPVAYPSHGFLLFPR